MAVPPLPTFRNFWVIWLNCAGPPTTLYAIQRDWGITTNYLYHREASLGKPLFQAMIDQGYVKKESRHLEASFSWIPGHIIEEHKIEQKGWTPSLLLLQNWPLVQAFLEKHRTLLFAPAALKALYKGQLDLLARAGPAYFQDLFLLAITANMVRLSQRYKAGAVERILYTFLALLPDRDLTTYSRGITAETEFPLIIKDEEEMLASLIPSLG
ncbi:MAG: hypothetical protein HY369_02065 [Candidatus Aenigmarchaeota archaeon]|nr:hypothetical protein [Candidatus Aenigmarchaeota archaeon]